MIDGVEEDSCPKSQDYTTTDNVRYEYSSLEPRIQENFSTRVTCCEHSWQSSYSKTISFGTKRDEETIQWCRDHLNWTQLQWEQVIWSDESSFTLFQTTGRVFVCQTPAEAFHVDCLVPTVKHGPQYLPVDKGLSLS